MQQSDEGLGGIAPAHGNMTLLSQEGFSRSASTKISFSLRFSLRQGDACVMICMIERMRRVSLKGSPLSTRIFAARKETRIWRIVSDTSSAIIACSVSWDRELLLRCIWQNTST